MIFTQRARRRLATLIQLVLHHEVLGFEELLARNLLGSLVEHVMHLSYLHTASLEFAFESALAVFVVSLHSVDFIPRSAWRSASEPSPAVEHELIRESVTGVKFHRNVASNGQEKNKQKQRTNGTDT